MKKIATFFVFIGCALLLPLFAVNLNNVFAGSASSNYFLEQPLYSEFKMQNSSIKLQKALALLNAKWVRSERVQGANVRYYYSDVISHIPKVLGANMQVATRGNQTIIGFPIILGSF